MDVANTRTLSEISENHKILYQVLIIYIIDIFQITGRLVLESVVLYLYIGCFNCQHRSEFTIKKDD
ncbi:hypothetical protein GCM10008013_17210 [Paenibacillus segetis]|uniref:Uncharacterized protein n=1 Tax=Paenibacillus segetis TaxID=1325360 RepID=A0ABQ1YD96_9BACL|nr:hypothetical protein GCM10008013_17210 [Paenibacillus segetis]